MVEENVISGQAGRKSVAVPPVLRTDLFAIEFDDPLNDDFLLL